MSLAPPPNFPVPPADAPTEQFHPRLKTRADLLIYLVKQNQWRRGVELGTGEGKTAAKALSKCLNLHLTTVDLWEGQPENTGPENWMHWPHRIHERAARARLCAYGRRVRIVKDYTINAAKRIEDGSLDFVLIDADHSERGVRCDIETWTCKIRNGGMLLGFEASWAGVKAAITDLCPDFWIGPDNTWGVTV